MRAIKWLAYGVGGLVVLAALALVAAIAVVDGAFLKSRLERMMKERNRTLVIEGTPKLSLFPVAGVSLGKTTLSESGSQRLFVALDSAEVAVQVMPLLSGEVALEKLNLAGLKANVVKGKDGKMNFADLLEGGTADEDARSGPPKVTIAQVNVERAQFTYRDEKTGQEVSVADFNFKAGRLDGAAPGQVSLGAHVTGRKPTLDLRAQAAGAMRFNLAKQELAFDGFSAGAKGRIDQDSLAAEFTAPKVEITPARASGAEVKGTVHLKGPQRNVNLVFRIEGIQGSAEALSLASMALDIDAAAAGKSVKGKVSTPVTGNLKARSWELPKVAANLTFAGLAIPQKTVTLPVRAAAKADLAKQTAALDLSSKFDESTIQAKLAVSRFEPLAATFDLTIDRVNLDRYLPADSKEGKREDAVDLSPLKGKTVSGKIAIGALTVKRVKMERVVAEMKLANGKLDIAPHSLNLYGGSVTGSLSVDANGNRIAVKETAQNVGMGPLLRDAAQKDVLEGRASLVLDVQTSGGTVTALKKALAGNARVEMKDGAVKGVNLADTARNVKSMVGMRSQKPDATQKTDFSEMSASFKIANGVARNDDLKALSPFLRLGGAGSLDIGNNGIDYLAKATLAATAKGQGGRDAKDVAGVTIPIKVTGALDNPSWNVDFSGLIGSSGGGIVDTVKQGVGGIGGAVRGLFKR
jgi:AsmA protein